VLLSLAAALLLLLLLQGLDAGLLGRILCACGAFASASLADKLHTATDCPGLAQHDTADGFLRQQSDQHKKDGGC
jgi:hypothetical protein